VWLLSAFLAIIANIGFGASFVAMNAYLPSLAKYSPEVVMALEELEADSGQTTADPLNEDPTHETDRDPLLPSSPLDEVTRASRQKYDTLLSNATSRISSLGTAMGYSAGILLLILALIPVTKLHGSTFSLRLAIALSGIWFLYFCALIIFHYIHLTLGQVGRVHHPCRNVVARQDRPCG
jgi:UMF1 family MFS transporter